MALPNSFHKTRDIYLMSHNYFINKQIANELLSFGIVGYFFLPLQKSLNIFNYKWIFCN